MVDSTKNLPPAKTSKHGGHNFRRRNDHPILFSINTIETDSSTEVQIVNSNNVQDVNWNNNENNSTSSSTVENDDVIFVDEQKGLQDIINLCTPPDYRHRHRNFGASHGIVLTNDTSRHSPITRNETQCRPNTIISPFTLTCAICLDSSARRQPTTTPCGHVFCNKCIITVLKRSNKCPLCNKILQRSKLIRLFID